MRTVVLERHGYGRGRHRFHPGILDFPRHCDLQPRLCAPYRAQTKGKVERFIRYLRHSFYVPLASRLAQEGLIVDRDNANLAVRRWLTPACGLPGQAPKRRGRSIFNQRNRANWARIQPALTPAPGTSQGRCGCSSSVVAP
jgi:hypothetical protein